MSIPGNSIDGTCRITIHGYTDLILPDFDSKWDYVLSDRDIPAWSADEKTIFEMKTITRSKDTNVPIEAYTLLTIEPDFLGQYSWGGNRALVAEHLDLVTGKHWFSFSVGVTDPDGMLSPETVLSSKVVRGTGRYADISGRYFPGEHSWEFDELIYEETPAGRSKVATWKGNQNLDNCDFPGWVKERLKNVFLPKLQNWFDCLPSFKTKGNPAPNHLSNYPSGNPRIVWKHWGEYMRDTFYICSVCTGEVGFRKAKRATRVTPAPRHRYGVDCFCDDHQSAGQA